MTCWCFSFECRAAIVAWLRVAPAPGPALRTLAWPRHPFGSPFFSRFLLLAFQRRRGEAPYGGLACSSPADGRRRKKGIGLGLNERLAGRLDTGPFLLASRHAGDSSSAVGHTLSAPLLMSHPTVTVTQVGEERKRLHPRCSRTAQPGCGFLPFAFLLGLDACLLTSPLQPSSPPARHPRRAFFPCWVDSLCLSVSVSLLGRRLSITTRAKQCALVHVLLLSVTNTTRRMRSKRRRHDMPCPCHAFLCVALRCVLP